MLGEDGVGGAGGAEGERHAVRKGMREEMVVYVEPLMYIMFYVCLAFVEKTDYGYIEVPWYNMRNIWLPSTPFRRHQ